MPNRTREKNESDILQTVKQTLQTHHMITEGERILVGVSGGPDSMALLHLLIQLAPDYHIQLGIAHLNHRLRGAAGKRDAAVVYKTAKTLGIPCHIRSADVMKVKKKLKLSLEDAARRVRYAFFNKIMRSTGYDKLAVGHQMEDNAEQMLLALVRGTGSRGLAGIAPVRGNRVIRPLIETSRNQIKNFLEKERIHFVKDASNEDPKFLRNRVRNRLLPLLAEEYNPRISEHLNRLADLTRTEESWIEEIVGRAYDTVKTESPDGVVHLSIESLRSQPLALQRRLVRKALENLVGGLWRISFSHVHAVVGLANVDRGEKTCHLPYGIRVLRSGNRLVLRQITRKARGIRAEKKKENFTSVNNHPLPVACVHSDSGNGDRVLFYLSSAGQHSPVG
jgi:tRNA(Ile)-lysidine synthase